METLGSLLPLTLLIAAIGGVIWWSRRRARMAPPLPELRGPSGWLGFFIFASYVLAPLVSLGSLSTEFTNAEAANPHVVGVPAWQQYKVGCWLLFGAVVAWQWWAAYNLHKRFVPGSVTIVKGFLLASPLVAGVGVMVVAWSTLNFNASEAAFEIFLRAAVSSVVWYLYFTFSRRVKNTYFMDARDLRKAASTGPSGERADPSLTPPGALEPVPPAPLPGITPAGVPPEPQPWTPEPGQATTETPERPAGNTAYSNALTVQLDALKRMHEREALTDAEYARKREELLSRI